jgi:peptidoglycan hydrolase-like protein with peptidoglycan-binding domain
LNVRASGKPKLREDGVFGPKTDNAVRDYQTKRGLTVDGVIGPKTRASLFPIGVYTVTVVGRRNRKLTSLWPQQQPTPPSASSLRWPPVSPSANLSSGALKLSDWKDLNGAICRGLCNPIFRPRPIWPLPLPVPAPVVPDWNFAIPPRSSAAPFTPFGFVYDHLELQPGAQSTFPIGDQRQDAFVLTMQSIYRRGPDDGAHQEAALGVQIGTPVTAIGSDGPWTFNPFIQLTDVDRFGKLGAFHYWQPYAQVGFQASGLGDPQPTLTAGLFPINLGLDVGDVLTLGFGAGMALNLNLQSWRVQAGPQVSFGLSLKFGKPEGPL